ncbi:Callose synthase 4 [Acorus calamus]|uniref:Callose synthase 4 n=1 Tax=Acorus calamus TaxID=4465 RepID=A0AAV9CIJ2_ACOCL|nr:Callose synthase 4 [Acorus calamus]
MSPVSGLGLGCVLSPVLARPERVLTRVGRVPGVSVSDMRNFWRVRFIDDEWKNYTERLNCNSLIQVMEMEESCHWALLRGANRLLNSYPFFRVAYIHECQRKHDMDSMIIYEIQLPGSPKLGEGKPENQNRAIILVEENVFRRLT